MSLYKNEVLKYLGPIKWIKYILISVCYYVIRILGRKEHFNSSFRFFNYMEREGIKFTLEDNLYHLAYKDHSLYLRKNSSDEDVFVDVILLEEYKPLVSLALANNIPVEKIMDAGANIGLTSIYLNHHFPAAQIIAIEPDHQNYGILVKNMSANLQDRFQLIEAGLASECGWLNDATVAGEREWGKQFEFSTLKKDDKSILAYDLESLLKKYDWENIDILKMDIEGTEEQIFLNGSTLSFLRKTKIVGIEIHHKVLLPKFESLLRENSFVSFSNGNMIYGLNKNILLHQ